MSNYNYHFSDEAYGKILDNFVIGCVDTLVVHKDRIILEKRPNNPIEGEWWIFGGRIMIGENFRQTARRGLQRELGISPAEERFTEIGSFNLVWPSRREPEASNGCHHLLIAHKVEIDEDEYQTINSFLEQNNIDARWFSPSELSLESLLPEMRAILEKANTPFVF